jgi:hypothetical protein
VPRRFSGYCTDVFCNEAIKFIDDHQSEPFFTHIALNAPHSPFNVENRYSDRYAAHTEGNADRANFYGMVTCIDDNIGARDTVMHALYALPACLLVASATRCFPVKILNRLGFGRRAPARTPAPAWARAGHHLHLHDGQRLRRRSHV